MTEKEVRKINGEEVILYRNIETGCYSVSKDAVEVLLKALEEIQKYRQLEEQGLLLRLPVKVGDTVFVIPSRVNCVLNRLNGHSENNRVYVQRVHSLQMYSNDRYLLTTCEGMQSVLSDTYKETWFLTKEEAEAALEKMKENR